jgi:uncharacterized membrane protein
MILKERTLRILMYAAALIGLVDSIYLTYVKLTHQQAFCGGYGGCETVATSSYASISGIPIAILGGLAYLAIIFLIYSQKWGGIFEQYAPMVIFGMTLAGFLYSLFLTWVEVAVLRAICPYCVVSAVVMTILFILSMMRLFGNQAQTEIA